MATSKQCTRSPVKSTIDRLPFWCMRRGGLLLHQSKLLRRSANPGLLLGEPGEETSPWILGIEFQRTFERAFGLRGDKAIGLSDKRFSAGTSKFRNVRTQLDRFCGRVNAASCSTAFDLLIRATLPAAGSLRG